MGLRGEREGEQRDRHSDKSMRRGSCTWESDNGNKLLSTSGEGNVEGFSKGTESFNKPSKSAKLTRNGSSVSRR